MIAAAYLSDRGISVEFAIDNKAELKNSNGEDRIKAGDYRRRLGIDHWPGNGPALHETVTESLWFPCNDINGTTHAWIARLFPALNGSSIKFISSRDGGGYPFIPLATWAVASKPHHPILITEGPPKALAALQAGICAIGVNGVWLASCKDGETGATSLHPAIRDNFNLLGRTVYLAFDADFAQNPRVLRALIRTAILLIKAGAEGKVLTWSLDQGKGLDDYLVRMDDPVQALKDLSDNAGDLSRVLRPCNLDCVRLEVASARLTGSKLSQFCKMVSKSLGVRKNLLEQEFKNYEPNGSTPPADTEKHTESADPDDRPYIVHPNCSRYVSDFGRELGSILKTKGFYRFHGAAVQVREVTVKSRNGTECQVKKLINLSSTEFSSLIELYCRPIIPTFIDKRPVTLIKSITLEMAKRTLVCLDFLNELPEITLWTDARLPVRSGENIILTSPGYDPVTGVYTSPDSPEIDETMTVEQAAQEWRDLLKEFCFPMGELTEEEEPDPKLREPERERCIAVSLAAAITPLCLYLMPEKAKRPGFAASANAEGAGKTLLLSFGMVAKLGYVPTGSAPDNEEEMRKVLDSAVHHGVPIIFFDNLKDHLSSGELEAFLTSSTRSYRVLGTTNSTEGDNLSTVYITANFATYSPDLRRRLLVVELFLEQARAEERSIDRFLDENALIEMRPRLLSILWAFIKDWHLKGESVSSTILPSFEHWSKNVGGIVENAGFSSPCQLATLKWGGDTDTQDMEKLVSEMPPNGEFKFSDLVDKARDHHLFPRLVPADFEMDKEQSSRLGKIIRKFVGRTFAARYKFCLSEGTRKTQRYYVVDLAKP